ncbi:uncharacterized protein YxeA [Anaerotaenia torta]|uniref:hypothetical protein n=1 Tax=Anaerotaenia torta TaxID=433293 RepID=UPI003D211BC7
MKKVIKTVILLFLMMGCFHMAAEKRAEASALSDVTLQEADDLDNMPYPDTTAVYYEYERNSYVKFTIDTPGEVRAYFRLDVNSRASGNIWISTDPAGKDIIGTISKFSGSGTELSWFLESGTYYLFAVATYQSYEANVALLFERSKGIEDKRATSFQDSNRLNFKEVKKGFLSNINANAYYSFEVKEKANAAIRYTFDSSAKTNQETGYCTLYDEDEFFLGEGSYTKTDKGVKEFNYLLEPGVYYVKLHGLYGNTTLQIVPMYYDIALTADTDGVWTTEPVEVNIDTVIDYKEIMVLFKDVKDTLIDKASVWTESNPAYVKLDGETFEARDSGIYSVRITDKFGNHSMKKIEISNVDVTKPVIKGVTDKKSYKKAVTITWTDKHSGINHNKTTLNGKKVTSGVKITEEGKYTLKVYDKIGNHTSVAFTIDRTAPTAGVEDGKTYKESVILKFRDNLSGISKIMVDNEEITASGNTYYCYIDGEYTVELWDKAGNYRKINFYIKRKY